MKSRAAHCARFETLAALAELFCCHSVDNLSPFQPVLYHHPQHPTPKSVFVVAGGVVDDASGIEMLQSLRFKPLHGTHQLFNGRVVEQQARAPVHHRIKRPFAAQRVDRMSGGHGLHRNDAEIFFSCENQCLAGRQITTELLSADTTQVRKSWAMRGIIGRYFWYMRTPSAGLR